MNKPKSKRKSKARARVIRAEWRFGEPAAFPVDKTGSHLDGDPLKSPFGEGEHCEQVPHLSDAIQTVGHVLGRGFYANQRGREGLLIQRLTLKHLAPRSTESGVDRDAWYRAIYQGIIALARTPHYERWVPTDPTKNPWRLPKSVAARIKPLEGQFSGGYPFFLVRAEYGSWRTPLSRRQMLRPLAGYRTWDEAITPQYGNPNPRPTKKAWSEELAFRKRITRQHWTEDQKYLLPCAWEEGRRLAAEDEKQRQEQAKRQAEKPAWIPEGLCVKYGVYVIEARNFSLGIFDGEGSFHGARYKYGPDPYLFAERHWDQGAPSGTAKPVRMIEQLPSKLIVRLSQYLGNRALPTKPLLNYLTKLAEKLREDAATPPDNSSSISSQKT
jgi:hypothetical protein